MLNGGYIYLEGIMSQTLAMIYNELIELMGGLITEGNENE